MLLERLQRDAGNESILDKFSNGVSYLIINWSKRDKSELLKYINDLLLQNKKQIVSLLKAFTNWTYLYNETISKKVDFAKSNYQQITFLFDKEYLYNNILEVYTLEEINDEPVKWIDKDLIEQNDLNIVRQFIDWKNDAENKLEDFSL